MIFIKKSQVIVAGIDEAGRGPLAGPVVAAAVIIPDRAIVYPEITDSKKLTSTQREKLFEKITDEYIYGIGLATQEEIDELNILQATFLAMTRAVAQLKVKPTLCLVDGNQKIPALKIKQKTIVKGDQKIKAISAASIVAKVFRDVVMLYYHHQYPRYNFAKHKGYGTKEHLSALKKHGRCSIHRRSFKVAFLDQDK